MKTNMRKMLGACVLGASMLKEILDLDESPSSYTVTEAYSDFEVREYSGTVPAWKSLRDIILISAVVFGIAGGCKYLVDREASESAKRDYDARVRNNENSKYYFPYEETAPRATCPEVK